jgi:polyphosphate kinase
MSLPAIAPDDDRPRYLDRELSWLDFNARVLALAQNASLPLLERAKFLAIFSSNLDEFFQVRVSGLKEQLAAGIRATSPDGMDQVEQLRAIRARVEELVTIQAAVFTKEVAPALQDAGVAFVDWNELDDEARTQLTLELYLELVVEPGGRRPRRRLGRAAFCARQGSTAAPALRRRSG